MSLRLETFEEELFQRLGREYRIRWSDRKETYCIEQQIAQPRLPMPRMLSSTDTWIRNRDGYALVAEVCPRPWMYCNRCRTKLDVPALKWAEVKCFACHESRVRNNTQFYVAYFPLCEKLLQHLESTSPKRGWEWIKEMKRENIAKVEQQDRAWRDHTEQGLESYRNVIAGNPVIGFGNGPTTFGAGRRM